LHVPSRGQPGAIDPDTVGECHPFAGGLNSVRGYSSSYGLCSQHGGGWRPGSRAARAAARAAAPGWRAATMARGSRLWWQRRWRGAPTAPAEVGSGRLGNSAWWARRARRALNMRRATQKLWVRAPQRARLARSARGPAVGGVPGGRAVGVAGVTSGGSEGDAGEADEGQWRPRRRRRRGLAVPCRLTLNV
jgi:hypothetical protein